VVKSEIESLTRAKKVKRITDSIKVKKGTWKVYSG
jgi:hypothetical protein